MDLKKEIEKIKERNRKVELDSAISVSFSKTFASTPQVVAVAKTSVPANCHCGITGNSTTGFTLNFYRNSNTATTVSWIAIGE